MRLLALSVAIAVATTVSFAVNAADLAYPAPMVGQPQYGVAPGPAVVPPQVIIVPGPAAPPRYRYGGLAAPRVVGPPPYDVGPPVGSPMAPPVGVAPSAPCAPTWRCGERGCGWQSICGPRPEDYSGAYEPLGSRVYSGPDPSPAPGPYSGPYAPQLDPRPTAPYTGDRSFYRP